MGDETHNPEKPPDQLATIRQELKDGVWVENAKQRAQRRKSAWNLLLPLFGLPLWGIFSGAMLWLATEAHAALYPHAQTLLGKNALPLNGALALIPSLIAGVPPAMLLTNYLVYHITAARRAMDKEDRDFPELGYTASQRDLFKLGKWVFIVCLPLIVIGVLIK